VNKKPVLEKIVAKLEHELEMYRRAAKAAFDEATSEQSKAENKYDTRGLEASYLARGQARQLAEVEEALLQFRGMLAGPILRSSTVAPGALVALEHGKELLYYFVANCAGGTEIVHDSKEILVITPQSPLGSQLANHKAGETVKLSIAGKSQQRRIAAVH